MDFQGLLDQGPPERSFPERKPSRSKHQHSSGTEANDYFERPVLLYFFHFIMDSGSHSVILPSYCKYLNTCPILLVIFSLSPFFFFNFPAQAIHAKGIKIEQG